MMYPMTKYLPFYVKKVIYAIKDIIQNDPALYLNHTHVRTVKSTIDCFIVYMFVLRYWNKSSYYKSFNSFCFISVSGVVSFITNDEQLQQNRGCCFPMHG